MVAQLSFVTSAVSTSSLRVHVKRGSDAFTKNSCKNGRKTDGLSATIVLWVGQSGDMSVCEKKGGKGTQSNPIPLDDRYRLFASLDTFLSGGWHIACPTPSYTTNPLGSKTQNAALHDATNTGIATTFLGQLEKKSASPDGVQHHELDLSAISQDTHHRFGYLIHGVAGSRAAVVVRGAHRQHNTTVARLEQRQRTPVQQKVSSADFQLGLKQQRRTFVV